MTRKPRLERTSREAGRSIAATAGADFLLINIALKSISRRARQNRAVAARYKVAHTKHHNGLAYLPMSADMTGKSSLQQAHRCELRMSRATRRFVRSRVYTSREQLFDSSSAPAWYMFALRPR